MRSGRSRGGRSCRRTAPTPSCGSPESRAPRRPGTSSRATADSRRRFCDDVTWNLERGIWNACSIPKSKFLIPNSMRISLFITCYNDTLFPETGKAVVRVLERLGHQVEFREAQTCCGQMHYNTGYTADAGALMEKFVRDFDGAEVICIPSASCVAMIRDHYPKMAAGSGDADLKQRVDAIIPRVFEFTELLVDTLGVTDVGASFPFAVTLHTSCHSLRSLHLGDRPAQLLRAVRGLEFRELPD